MVFTLPMMPSQSLDLSCNGSNVNATFTEYALTWQVKHIHVHILGEE